MNNPCLVLEGGAVNRRLSLSAYASDVIQGNAIVWEETSMDDENPLLFARLKGRTKGGPRDSKTVHRVA